MDDWERKLASVKIRKEDMNRLIMNFLVTEVGLSDEGCQYHVNVLLFLASQDAHAP